MHSLLQGPRCNAVRWCLRVAADTNEGSSTRSPDGRPHHGRDVHVPTCLHLLLCAWEYGEAYFKSNSSRLGQDWRDVHADAEFRAKRASRSTNALIILATVVQQHTPIRPASAVCPRMSTRKLASIRGSLGGCGMELRTKASTRGHLT